MTHEEAVAAYEEASVAFTELNKQYNQAKRTDSMTDELELQFLRAERQLKELYATQAALAVEE
jgi:hypothetical protein